MRNFILFAFVSIFIFSCTSDVKDRQDEKNNYTIIGKTIGRTYGTFSIGKFTNGKFTPVFSKEIIDGKFTITGTYENPEIYFYTLNNINMYGLLIIDAPVIELNITIKGREITGSEVTGSPAHKLYKTYHDSLALYRNKNREVYNKYFLSTEADKIDSLKIVGDSLIRNIEKQKQNFILSFVSKNANNIIGPFILKTNVDNYSLEQLDSVLKLFDESLHTSGYYIELKNKIDVSKRIQTNKPYVDFTMNDPEGNQVNLSDLIGKGYLLLDFWASWCRPCRNENANLVQIYDQYKDKGFEILSVSLDTDKEAWLKAIETDGLTWPQLSDLKYNNLAKQLYGVESIPDNFLIDKNGKIIARKLRGEKLKEKLGDLFK